MTQSTKRVEIGRFPVAENVKDALVKGLHELPRPAGMEPLTIKEYCRMALLAAMKRDGMIK